MIFSGMPALEYPHLQKIGDEPARLKRVRTRVSMIVTDYLGGWSADKILEEYPYLLPGEVYSALGYYFDHKEEIDAELEKVKALIEEMKTPESPKASAVRQRLRALRNAG